MNVLSAKPDDCYSELFSPGCSRPVDAAGNQLSSLMITPRSSSLSRPARYRDPKQCWIESSSDDDETSKPVPPVLKERARNTITAGLGKVCRDRCHDLGKTEWKSHRRDAVVVQAHHLPIAMSLGEKENRQAARDERHGEESILVRGRQKTKRFGREFQKGISLKRSDPSVASASSVSMYTVLNKEKPIICDTNPRHEVSKRSSAIFAEESAIVCGIQPCHCLASNSPSTDGGGSKILSEGHVSDCRSPAHRLFQHHETKSKKPSGGQSYGINVASNLDADGKQRRSQMVIRKPTSAARGKASDCNKNEIVCQAGLYGSSWNPKEESHISNRADGAAKPYKDKVSARQNHDDKRCDVREPYYPRESSANTNTFEDLMSSNDGKQAAVHVRPSDSRSSASAGSLAPCKEVPVRRHEDNGQIVETWDSAPTVLARPASRECEQTLTATSFQCGPNLSSHSKVNHETGTTGHHQSNDFTVPQLDTVLDWQPRVAELSHINGDRPLTFPMNYEPSGNMASNQFINEQISSMDEDPVPTATVQNFQSSYSGILSLCLLLVVSRDAPIRHWPIIGWPIIGA